MADERAWPHVGRTRVEQVRVTVWLYICARELPSSHLRQVTREAPSGVFTAFLGPSRYTPKLMPWKMQHRLCLNPSLIIIGGILPPHLNHVERRR